MQAGKELYHALNSPSRQTSGITHLSHSSDSDSFPRHKLTWIRDTWKHMVLECTRKWTKCTSQGICSLLHFFALPSEIQHFWCSFLEISYWVLAILLYLETRQRPEIESWVEESKYFQSALGNDRWWKHHFQKMGKLELEMKMNLIFALQAQYSFTCQTTHPCNTSKEFYIQSSLFY